MKPFLAELIGTAILITFGNGVVANMLLTDTKGHGGGPLPHQPGGSPGGAGERGSRRRGVGVRPGVGVAACRVVDARSADGGW